MNIFSFKSRALAVVIMASVVWLSSLPVSHASPRIGAALQAAFLDIDGHFGLQPNSELISLTSNATALGLKQETVFQPRADFDWKDWHLWLIGFQAGYAGSGILEAKVQIGNLSPIAKGTPVRTDVGFKYLTANLVYDVLPTDAVELGIGLGGGLIDYELSFKSEVSPVRAGLDDTLPFVFPIARIAKDIGNFELVGTIAGLSAELGAHDITYMQIDAGINYRIFDRGKKLRGNITLGYQYFSIDYVYEGQNSTGIIDVFLSGPYLGFGFFF